VFPVLSKVSKNCETGLKILSDTDRSSRETKEDTVIVLTLLMRYIQDEEPKRSSWLLTKTMTRNGHPSIDRLWAVKRTFVRSILMLWIGWLRY